MSVFLGPIFPPSITPGNVFFGVGLLSFHLFWSMDLALSVFTFAVSMCHFAEAE